MLNNDIWPKSQYEDLLFIYFEWYSTKVRPFMVEFYDIMIITNQAGLSNQSDIMNHSSPKSAKDLDNHHRSNSQNQQIRDQYMSRFKFLCTNMEDEIFKNKQYGKFIFGESPSCIDHVIYQELLSAMVLSGSGT